MDHPRILAHDLGTTGDKATLHDRSGRLLASVTVPWSTAYGPGGTAEQDPAAWWAAVAAATRRLLAETATAPADVAVVSLSGMMQGAVLADAAGDPVRPAIIWADHRAGAECAALVRAVGLERAYAIGGHRLDPTYTLAKAAWVRAHEPAAWARVASILQVKDWVRLRLTGTLGTDPSDASGTNAWDQAAGTWSATLLDAAGIPASLLPPILPSGAIAGSVTAAAAGETGLREGTPVVTGGGDGSLAALGAGLVSRASGANCYLGSSSWISVASDVPLRDPRMRTMTFDHVIPGRFIPIGTMQTGGASLDWIAGVTAGRAGAAGTAGGSGTIADLVAAAATVGAADDGLFFLPYLIGERSPWWRTDLRGTFLGIGRHHGPAHLARAVLEGVAFNLRTILDALVETGGPVGTIDAIGGGAKSDAWLAILATILGTPVRRRSLVDEAGALGAAVLGGIGVGLIDRWEAAGELSAVVRTFDPDPAGLAAAERGHRRFLDAVGALSAWHAAGAAQDGIAHGGTA